MVRISVLYRNEPGNHDDGIDKALVREIIG